jgi:hypothetical protein
MTADRKEEFVQKRLPPWSTIFEVSYFVALCQGLLTHQYS